MLERPAHGFGLAKPVSLSQKEFAQGQLRFNVLVNNGLSFPHPYGYIPLGQKTLSPRICGLLRRCHSRNRTHGEIDSSV
jgi:hypothetical protein